MQIVLPPDLTVAQTVIWLDQQLFPGRPIYNTGGSLTIRGHLQFDLFETALRETVAESPSLRLPPRSGPLHFNLPLLDFRDRKDPLAAAEQWMRAEMGRSVSLDDPALFRFALIQISEDQTLWFQKISPYHYGLDWAGNCCKPALLPAIVHSVLASLWPRSTPPRRKKFLIASGAIPRRAIMKLIMPIG